VSDDLIQFGPRAYVSETEYYLVKALTSIAVSLAVLSLTEFSCKDSGNLFGHSAPVPGSLGSAHAFGNGEGEISLVSLIFLESEEIECLSVVDRITDKPIPYRSAVWEGNAVVTLELPKGQLANPRLAFRGGASFTALLTPEFSLSTFDGLCFGDHTVFLRDHGVEIELKAGMEKVISQTELINLWIGDKLAKAVRVRFSSETAGSYDPILEPETGTVAVKQKSQLITLEGALEMGGRESASLVVAPPTDTETIRFSVVAR
jgi:hypothetical protein